MKLHEIVLLILLLIANWKPCALQEQNESTTNDIFIHQLTNNTQHENQNIDIEQIHHIRRITPIMFRRESANETVCINSEDDFPNFLTPEQRRNGGVVISFVIGIYCFSVIAIICDKYFLPCVERICEALNLSQDVAAATFMAMATSAPELFVNIIGTFITESEIGIGTVIGSSMFNSLGVGALGGLAAASPIQVDWWPVTRDTILYITSISLLVVMTWDGLIFWYEGMILFIVYFLYFIVMFNNKRISKHVRNFVNHRLAQRNPSTEEIISSKVSESKPHPLQLPVYFVEDQRKNSKYDEAMPEKQNNNKNNTVICYSSNSTNGDVNRDCQKPVADEENSSDWIKLFTIPKGKWYKKVFFFYIWPIRFILFCAIPNPKTFPRLFPLTFVMCIVFIGMNSYIVSWMITIIGHTFSISDSLLGLTLLAAGGCLPEAMSIIIMSRKGEGSMGVSNALGANTMNILLSLGLPWFIKTLILETSNTAEFIEISSGSIEYTILSLIVVAITLYLVLYFNKFKLSKSSGIILSIVYLLSITTAILLNIFTANEVASCELTS